MTQRRTSPETLSAGTTASESERSGRVRLKHLGSHEQQLDLLLQLVCDCHND